MIHVEIISRDLLITPIYIIHIFICSLSVLLYRGLLEILCRMSDMILRKSAHEVITVIISLHRQPDLTNPPPDTTKPRHPQNPVTNQTHQKQRKKADINLGGTGQGGPYLLIPHRNRISQPRLLRCGLKVLRQQLSLLIKRIPRANIDQNIRLRTLVSFD
jgi:hypothetical protein